MLLSLASLLSMATIASAVPFKRYDNETEPAGTLSQADTTITIDKYITITLSSASLASPTVETETEVTEVVAPTTLTSTVTEFATVSEGGSLFTTPITTKTTTFTSNPTTTSTITSFVTITQATQVSDEVCVPQTKTVTVTEIEKAASVSGETVTYVSSYPIEAEFTSGKFTTTITSYIDITTTKVLETSLQTTAYHSNSANGTYTIPSNLRRADVYAF